MNDRHPADSATAPAESSAPRTVFVPRSDTRTVSIRGEGFEGVSETLLIGAAQTSVHQEIVLVELAPGGVIPGHFHPFEESFLVLEGTAVFAIGTAAYEIRAGDFGFAPIGVSHAWRNTSANPVRWIEIRVPQPKVIGDARGTYADRALTPPTSGRPVTMGDPTCRFVSHFDEDDMPPYGPMVAKGALNYAVKHISARFLVTEVMGAIQHLTFIVQLPPAPLDDDSIRDLLETDPSTKYHFHAYEEAYHFLEGHGLAYLDGRTFEVGPGDTILAGVGGSHAVINISDQPLRWIETMAPSPPPQDSLFWEKQWLDLEPIRLSSS